MAINPLLTSIDQQPSSVSTTIAIRAERPSDAPLIAEVVKRAYADVAYSDHREHLMIERLRSTDAFLTDLSLLAEIGDETVGHVLLTKARIINRDTIVDTLALAPLSVVPEHQGRGVGRSLIEAAHLRAAALGFGSIVLVGIPGYYPRFGYAPLDRYPITLPFSAPADNCMVLPLSPQSLVGVSGIVEYPPGWLEH
ncbi:MAG: N-acetyltransferase [Gemmatimonadota bacterium]|nr:N-acetyltransferase [Gemmatimonadota bacterium]